VGSAAQLFCPLLLRPALGWVIRELLFVGRCSRQTFKMTRWVNNPICIDAEEGTQLDNDCGYKGGSAKRPLDPRTPLRSVLAPTHTVLLWHECIDRISDPQWLR
jgi:hypothetical protein